MATRSSILAWRIPWTEEPGWLQSMGSQRVGHDWEAEHPHTLSSTSKISILHPTQQSARYAADPQ